MARSLRDRLTAAILLVTPLVIGAKNASAAPAAASPSNPAPAPTPADSHLPPPDNPVGDASVPPADSAREIDTEAPSLGVETPGLGSFAGVDSGLVLWKALALSGNPAGHAALALGPGGASSLDGPGGLNFEGLRFGGFNLGGFVDRDPGAALPDGYQLGYEWNDGSAAWGDGAAALGTSETAALDRSLQGLQLNLRAGPGQFSLAAGEARLQERHVILSGRASPGPYFLNNSGPILIGTTTVRVDGLIQTPDNYSIDPVGGTLQFDHEIISELSIIDVRYEERRTQGNTGGRVVGAHYALPMSARSSLDLTLLSSRPGDTRGGGMRRITEGPYYATGLPMTLTLGQGVLLNVESVTVDGAPLREGRDYRVFPSARALFLFRALPPGSPIEVTYWYQSLGSEDSSASVVGLDSTDAIGSSARLRWSVSAGQSGAAMDMGTSAPLFRRRLILGARIQDSTASFQTLPGLLSARRQNGVDVGLTALPTRGLHFTGRFFDAAAPSQLPFLDVGSGESGPLVRITGMVLEGGLSLKTMPALHWSAGAYREAAAPFDRETLSASYTHGGWGFAAHAVHVAATSVTSGAAPGVGIVPTSAFPSGRLDTGSASISANVRPIEWLTGAVSGSWSRSVLGAWNGTSSLERASVLVTPSAGITLTAGFAADNSEIPPWIGLTESPVLGGSAVNTITGPLASIMAAGTESFDPAYALAHSPGTPGVSPFDSGAPFVTPPRAGLPPGVFFPPMPTDFGSGASRAKADVNTPLQSATGWTPQRRIINMSMLWNASPTASLQLSGADEQYHENLAGGDNRLVDESAATVNLTGRYLPQLRGFRNGALQLTGSIGRSSAKASQVTGASATGWIGQIGVAAAPTTRWRLGANFSRAGAESLNVVASEPTFPGESAAGAANAIRLIATRALSSGRLLFGEWNSRNAAGPGGFLTRSAAFGVDFPLPAGFGLQFRAQHSFLSAATTPRPNYSADTLSISLVSMRR
ncbi:MAG TPA: hypothetical protein VFJ58_18315 [Armatimonadota bacterium]|nr:hypothetical protein [Armatimonadota bacterium]